VQMVFRVLSAVDEKIQESAKEREERKKFEIKYDGDQPLVESMTVREPYEGKASDAQQSKQQQPEP
jgi:hypothetical protein